MRVYSVTQRVTDLAFFDKLKTYDEYSEVNNYSLVNGDDHRYNCCDCNGNQNRWVYIDLDHH